MSAPTVIRGKDGTVKVGASALTGQVTSFSVTVNNDTAETTTLGNSWKTYQATNKSWSGSITVKYDNTNTQIDAIEDALFGTGASLALVLGIGGTGGESLSGDAIITSMPVTNNVDGVVEVSFSFQGTGTLTRGIVA